jgi:hypothetical protein
MRLLQIHKPGAVRRVGIIEDQRIRLLDGTDSVYSLVQEALTSDQGLQLTAERHVSHNYLEYDDIYWGHSEWKILPAMDHPKEPARCLVSGTGLTHIKSAQNRQAMHAADATLTDSMRMYQWGVEGGRPAAGKHGISPEWFFKGCGTILRAHGEPLCVPPYAEDGGEEPEIAGVYVVDRDGVPWRIGMATGNEFSDHVFEQKNYLYLAASKLMPCAIGPELVLDPDFRSVSGEVSIEREGSVVWQRAIRTGEALMSHSLANIEHHHFKHYSHRRPGDVHIHYFGADVFSFGEGVSLKNGDIVRIEFEGFGRALRNPIHVDRSAQPLVTTSSL